MKPQFRQVVVPKYLEDRLSRALCVESTVDLDEHLRAIAAVVVRAEDAARRALIERNARLAEHVKGRIEAGL